MTETKQADRTGEGTLLGLAVFLTGVLAAGCSLIGLWLATAGQKLCTIAPEGPHRDECLAQATLGAVLCFATVLIPVSIWWSNRRPAAR